jgi:hypothetical protein
LAVIATAGRQNEHGGHYEDEAGLAAHDCNPPLLTLTNRLTRETII